FITLLPRSISYYILSMLHPRSWTLLCTVNQTWYSIIKEEEFWEYLFKKMKVSKVADVNYWPGDIKQNSYKVYLIQRWNKRFFKTRKIEMHEESITCLLYQHPYVITASAERTIKILDVCNDKQVATLEGHKDTISAMAVQKDILVSASFDKSIRIWSLSERKEKQFLTGHKSSVNTVQYRKSLIASGSSDKTVRLWRYNMDGTFAHHRTLNGHESGIKCLDFDDYILLSMSFDQQLRMWHLATGNCVRMWQMAYNGINNLLFD
ncbi:WD40 repeat-like protein, partial [Rozella allomycis CSF55]